MESVVNQTYRDLEIILVDDGSPDRCPQICDNWGKRDKRIKVIHKSNGGLSDARNTGLDVFKGEFVAFIDSDDWVEENYVERLLETALKEEADIVSCGLVNEYENCGKSYASTKEPFSGNSEEALTLLYDQTRIPVAAAIKLYKREIWEKMRFPVGKVYEDALTTYKAFDSAKKIVQISDCLYHYRIRDNSIMTSAFSLKTTGLCQAWKENYLFCKQKYPRVAPKARKFWLEHIPPVLSQFPKHLTKEEEEAKKNLKKDIRNNLGYIVSHMAPKKVYHQLKALCYR